MSQEGRTLEFKREKIPQKLASILGTIMAFSNGSGGEIIIGVAEDKQLVDLQQDPFELEERLAS